MQIYVINLDSNMERMRWMSEQLSALHLNYERFRAIHGEKLWASDLEFSASPLRSPLGKGEIGCLLSHIGVWKHLVSSGRNAALVLEDDAHIDPRLSVFLNEVRIEADEPCIYKVETMRARVTIARRPVFKQQGIAAYQLHSHHAGSAAYVISRKAAETLLELSDSFTQPIDKEIFNFEKDSKIEFPIYQLVPALCIQDVLVQDGEAKLGFTSNIGLDRVDARNGWLLPQTSLPTRLKAVAKGKLRPLYTSAYSLRLSLKGRRRLQVEYAELLWSQAAALREAARNSRS